MPVQDKTVQKPTISGDAVNQMSKQQTQTSVTTKPEGTTTRVGKEQDVVYREQGELLAEVKEKYREADLEAQKQVEKALGKETKSANGEVVIPPDLVDHGVKSPQDEASTVVERGSTIELPMSEDDYEGAEKSKISGKSLPDKEVIGVSSLAALAMFVGRLIKVAHKHAKRLVFRKGDNN